jgi:hypothetical protein
VTEEDRIEYAALVADLRASFDAMSKDLSDAMERHREWEASFRERVALKEQAFSSDPFPDLPMTEAGENEKYGSQ